MRGGGRPSATAAQVFGLARPRDLGVELVHCTGVYYDWARRGQTCGTCCVMQWMPPPP